MAWRNFTVSISHRHTVEDVALEAKHTKAELALNQFTNKFDATVCERVDIVGWILGIVEANNFADDSNEIFHLQSAVNLVVWRIKTKTLVDLVATNTRIVITTIVVEGAINHVLCVFDSREIAWAKTTIDFKCSLRRVAGWIFLKCIFDVMNVAVVDFFEVVKNLALFATKGTQKCGYWDLFATVDFDIDYAFGIGLKLEPSTATWNDLGTVIIVAANGLG